MNTLLPFDLAEVVDGMVVSDERVPDGLLHASSHLMGSLRHAQLDLAGAPKYKESLIERVPAFTGTLWHARLDEELAKYGVWRMPEIDISPHLPTGWGGRADYVIWNPGLRGFVLCDIKTTNGDAMYYITRDGAKPEHQWQTSMYWYGLQKSGLPLVKAIAIFYLPVSKPRGGSCSPVQVEFPPLPKVKIFNEAKTRHAACQKYLASLPYGWEDGGLEPAEFLTPLLAPVQPRVQKVRYVKKTGVHELILAPHWSAQFCKYPEALCDCALATENKIGEWDSVLLDSFIPRAGYENIKPEVTP